ncbi:hypothetical protein F5148DRAFT_1286556 [Russula earlei]|uniref:Uncharacterized protein n=1 Tax=Russula earlei TaxID=71964 RepID=A0ACC0U3T8_9AGAM|nr:hypothetical protein F5148DRAFT_1286556 [Russula earlei]
MSLGKIFGAPSPAEAALSPAKAARVPSESSAANSLFYHPDITAQSGQWKEELSQHTESYGRALRCTIKARPGRSSAHDPETPSRKKGIFTELSDRGSRPVSVISIGGAEASPPIVLPLLLPGQRLTTIFGPCSWSQVGKLQSGACDCCRHHFGHDMGPRAPDTIGHRMPASMSKVRKVMQWLRLCSKGHGLDDDRETSVPLGRKLSDCDRSESTILPPKKSTTEQQELEMLNHTQMTNLL